MVTCVQEKTEASLETRMGSMCGGEYVWRGERGGWFVILDVGFGKGATEMVTFG